MTEFQREERFIVVKRKHIADPEMEKRFRLYIKNYLGVETVECVVVESDWPEYETVWKMIEARVSGNPAMTDTQALIERLRAIANLDSAKALTVRADDLRCILAALTEAEAKLAKAMEAIGILEDALQEAGDDYPGSNMQEWCQQQIKSARATLAELVEG